MKAIRILNKVCLVLLFATPIVSMGSGFVFSGSAPTPPSNYSGASELVLLNVEVMGPIEMDVRATYDFFTKGEFYNTGTGLTENYTMNTVDWEVNESSLPAPGLSIDSDGTFDSDAYPSASYPRVVSIDVATSEGAPDDMNGDPIVYEDDHSLTINQPSSDLNYTDWVSSETTLSGSDDGEEDDPEADGSVNLIEFALDTDPETANSPRDNMTETYDPDTGDYTMSITIPNDRREVTYTFQTTTDLSANPIVWQDQEMELESSTSSTETWSTTINLGDQAFGRLQIETYTP
ncbi:MAG: hypothetical protein ACSHX8_07520 [Opitutaceae bacterium]